MYYVLSVALAALGIFVLGAVLLHTVRLLRRYNRTVSMVTAESRDRVGLLRARSAAVRVAVARRRDHARADGELHSTIDVNE
ncbi:bacteriophage holin [Qaidamihabitans albus]|uniref:bacteriophage holin n=1 Tax=Qaidamihabitans albus TaxID=2795733 RepID=UPI0018F1D578|nr:bacteriophage holin [Qaidamihabitans albus]